MDEPISFSLFRGTITATGSPITALAAQHSTLGNPNHPSPSFPHVTIFTRDEIRNLPPSTSATPKVTHLLARLRAVAADQPPVYLQRRTVCRGTDDGNKTTVVFLAVFWPQVQAVRAENDLPPAHFHITLQATPCDIHTISKLATALDTPKVNTNTLLTALRTALRHPTVSHTPVLNDILHTATLLQTAVQQSPHNDPQAPTIAELLLVAHIKHQRANNTDVANLSNIIDSFIQDHPKHAPLYLHRAAFHVTQNEFQLAFNDIWHAALTLNSPPSSHPRITILLSKLSPHLHHPGLDLIYTSLNAKDMQSHDYSPATRPLWPFLTEAQCNLHDALLQRAFVVRTTVPRHHPSPRPPTKFRAFVPYLAEFSNAQLSCLPLPRNFSLFLTPHLAASATPTNRHDIHALFHARFTLILTLCMENRLPSSWFDTTNLPQQHNVLPSLIRNVNITVRDHHPPTLPQIDAIITHVARNADSRTLIHCVGGKGRTGTVLACLVALYGFETLLRGMPRLCERCLRRMGVKDGAERSFVGCCSSSNCALSVRRPSSRADEAVALVRDLRPPSVEGGRQEGFVREWVSELWRRVSLFDGCEDDDDDDDGLKRFTLLYPERIAHDAGVGDGGMWVTGRFRRESRPKLVVLCGLQGAGKTFLVKEMEKILDGRVKVIHASQDALGSRQAVEACVSQAVKAGCHDSVVVVDRVNATFEDRVAWLRVAFNVREAVVVHVATGVDVSVERAGRRVSHETLAPWGVEGVIRGVAKVFEGVGGREVDAGFAGVVEVWGNGGVGEFLRVVERWGSREDDVGGFVESEGIRKEDRGCGEGGKRKIEVVGRRVVEERPTRLKDFYKFPRTEHLFYNADGGIGADDLTMTASRAFDLMASLEKIARVGASDERSGGGKEDEQSVRVTLEEKVDGANVGFSIDEESGAIRAQNRSHYVNRKSHAQFEQIEYYMREHEDDLRFICEGGDDGGRCVLYGEWMYATHSIHYTNLPSPFLAFDIYDITQAKFLSRRRFHAVMGRTGIDVVPMVALPVGGTLSAAGLVAAVEEGKSRFVGSEEVRAEGVYIRVDEGDWLRERAKVVRSDFIAGNDHWTKRAVQRNDFRAI